MRSCVPSSLCSPSPTQSSFSNRFGHFFDLTRSMDPARVEAVERVVFDAMEKSARYGVLLCGAKRIPESIVIVPK